MQLDGMPRFPLEAFGLWHPATLRLTVDLDPHDVEAARQYGSYGRAIATIGKGDEAVEITLRMLTRRRGVTFWRWSAEPLYGIRILVIEGLRALSDDWRMRSMMRDHRRVRASA